MITFSLPDFLMEYEQNNQPQETYYLGDCTTCGGALDSKNYSTNDPDAVLCSRCYENESE